MANYVLLNNIAHKNLKVITENSAKYGDDVMFAITFPQEFRSIQGCYPILFNKDAETGKFFPAALLGLRLNENLFLTEKGWDSPYIPLSIKRLPFLIGYQQTQEDGVLAKNMVIHIDMDSPRVNESTGEAVFMPHGGSSAYLEDVASMLDYISVGSKFNDDFIAMLLEFDLLESLTLDIELKNGSKNQLLGFYTINEEKLAALDSSALTKLHGKGFLFAIYMVLSSLSHIPDLITRMEKKLGIESTVTV